jgi:catechol 2,3-dioxygenase-like lactoylglutathione lyase family enzyme
MQVIHDARGMYATLPAADMDRAKRWYAEKLGLTPAADIPDGALYEVGDSRFLVYLSVYAGTNQATAATLSVDDVERTAEALRQAGVTLEQWDLPNASWENGVATMKVGDRDMHGIWFRDSEGNILGATDFPTR